MSLPPDRFRKRPARKTPPAPDPALANLETDGEQLKIYSLARLLEHKTSGRKKTPSTLAEVLVPWFEKHVAKPSAKLGMVSDIWASLVPPALVEHTRLVNLQRGTLTVALSNATARAELDGMLRRGLQRKLQELSKGQVYRVKTIVEPGEIPEVS